MTPLLAIVKLTCRSALRSHVFQFLLGLLVLSVLLVPNTIKGDGTAYGYIQVSLDYSLGFIAFILSMSALWLGASVMSSDVESGQLHMIAVKPVSRIAVWFGKLLGVLLIHAVLLAIAAAAVYGFVSLQFKWQKFAPDERKRVEDEVLTGRRAYLPDFPDIEPKVREEFEKRVLAAEASGGKMKALSGLEQRKHLSEIRKQLVANMGEVKPGPEDAKAWDYSGLPEKVEGPVCFRYKVFSGSLTSKDQKTSYGIWGARSFLEERPDSDDSSQPGVKREERPKAREIYLYRSETPEPILCGAAHEFQIPGPMIVRDGKARIVFMNLDPEMKSLFFQVADGPKLLIKETGFLNNYARAVFVILLEVFTLAGLACAAGSALSMPTAVFMVVAYIAMGSFSSFLIGSSEAYGDAPPTEFIESFGLATSRVLRLGLIPLQDFSVSDKIANGELVELSHVARLLLNCVALKALPIFALGAWLYWRRELGLAVKR